jgi:poly(A) polymerase
MKKELRFESQQLKKIMQILAQAGARSRLIGGCVRDALLDKPADDIDIATTLEPSKVISALEAQGVKVVLTGIKHGSVSAFLQSEKFEITTLRKDISCDGRRAVIEYTHDFFQDALRRDFTINALGYCPFEQKIFDYFEGLEHLKQKRVIFICDPILRITQDHLRILRFFRFSACYAEDFDDNGLQACKNNAHLLSSLSRERINMEFDKILLRSDDLVKVLSAMGSEVLRFIFPSLICEISKLHIALQCSKNLGISIKLETIYAILLSSNEYADLSELKFSNLRKKQVQKMLSFTRLKGLSSYSDNILSSFQEHIELHLKKIWISDQGVLQFVLLAVVFEYLDQDNARKLLNFFNSTAIPSFPFLGSQLMSLGYTGKDIGNMLNCLYDTWILKDFKITPQELIKCLENKNLS